jgi:hypothetical protein
MELPTVSPRGGTRYEQIGEAGQTDREVAQEAGWDATIFSTSLLGACTSNQVSGAGVRRIPQVSRLENWCIIGKNGVLIAKIA